MEKEIKTITQKLLDFQNNVDVIKKDSTNPHFKNTYASLNQILASVKPILNALKLVLIQPVMDGEVNTMIICSETGESVASSIKITEGLTPQQYGSAITYFRRYSLTSLLALEIDDDDDGNKATEKAPEFVSTTHDKPWLNKFEKDKTTISEAWQKASEMVKAGTVTIAKIEEKYRLSNDLKAELKKINESR